MKKLISITIASLALLSLSGCNKDNDTPKPEPTKLVKTVVVQFQEAGGDLKEDSRTTLTYDNNNRVVECTEVGTNYTMVSKYTYTKDKIVVALKSGSNPEATGEYLLNDKGLAYKFNAESVNHTYAYNANKELQTQSETDRITTFTWVDGNVEKCVQRDIAGTEISTRTYKYSDKVNRTNFMPVVYYAEDLAWFTWSGFFGAKSKNWVSELSDTGSLTTRFTYDFDSAGYPVKVTEIYGDNEYKYIYTITYI